MEHDNPTHVTFWQKIKHLFRPRWQIGQPIKAAAIVFAIAIVLYLIFK